MQNKLNIVKYFNIKIKLFIFYFVIRTLVIRFTEA